MNKDLNPRPHCLILTENGKLQCVICKNTWKNGPQSLCVGIPVYPGRWENVWPQGLMTKSQLDRAGYSTGNKLPAPAGLLYWKKSPQGDGYLRLYNPSDAVPKKKPTAAQQEALRKAHAANRRYWHCDRCGLRVERYKAAYCDECEIILWARDIVSRSDIVILDMETTGLSRSDDPIEIAVIDGSGRVLMNTLVKPRRPGMINPAASQVHSLTDSDLTNAPAFPDIYPTLCKAVQDRLLLIYNFDYDAPLLTETVEYYGLSPLPYNGGECVMEAYAQYCGYWSWRHHSYKWQPLPGGDHTALGDCRATLRVLHDIANDTTKDPPNATTG